jgi:hypothetical protein
MRSLAVLEFACLFLLTSCSDSDSPLAKRIIIDGEKLTLANGYIGSFGPDEDDNGDPVSVYLIILTSTGLVINEQGNFAGTGDVVLLQMLSPSAIELKSGTYNFGDPNSSNYFKGSAFSIVYKMYNPDAGAANAYQVTSGTLKISKSGSTFKISFTVTLQESNLVNPVNAKGSFEGKLVEILL